MSEDIITSPILATIPKGIIVKKPEGELAAPQVWEFGGASVGSDYLPEVGAVLQIALHHPDGTTLIACFSRPALAEFATKMNGEVARISNGLVRAETRQ